MKTDNINSQATTKAALAETKDASTKPQVNFGGGRSDNHGIVEKAADTKGTLKRLISYFGDFKGLFICLILVVICSTGAAVAIPSLEGAAIDSISDKLWPALITELVWLLVMFVIQSVCSFGQTRLAVKLGQLITRRLRKDLFGKITTLPIRYIDTHSKGDVMSRMTSDVENISSTISQSLSSFISSTLTVLGTFIIMLVYCWQLTLVTMVVVFLTVFSTKKLSKIMGREFRKKAAINGRMNAHSEEMITGYRSVTAFNRQEDAEREYAAVAAEFKKVSIKAESLSNGVGPVLDCISNVGFVVVAVAGGLFALNDLISIGIIAAFIIYAKQFIRPINEIAQLFGSIQTAIAGAERVFAMLDEPSEEGLDGETASADEVGAGAIVFKDVNFSYTPDTQVLHDFSLDIKPGQKIALVGATGSGKTTVVNLLERFYDADSGAITIDGQDIFEMPLKALRKRIAIVLQDTVLFSDTIARNIKYADSEASDARMVEAAKISNCADFIERLPKKYDTFLTHAGSNLSQGQRQLLTIARAVLADPDILILDEATSSVDTKTEKQIQDAMANLMKDRTSLIIAHRLSTIQDADKIIVLDHGRIVESGNHEELLKAKGRYHELYMTQFAGNLT